MYGQDQGKAKEKRKSAGGEVHGETWFYKDTPDTNSKDKPIDPKKKKCKSKKGQSKSPYLSQSQQQQGRGHPSQKPSQNPYKTKKLKNGLEDQRDQAFTSGSITSNSSSSSKLKNSKTATGSKINVSDSKPQQYQSSNLKSGGPSKTKKLKNDPDDPNTSNSITTISSSSNAKGSKPAIQGQGSKLNVTTSNSQIHSHKHKHKKCPRKSKKEGGNGGQGERPSKSQSTTQIKSSGKRVNYNPNLVESKSFTSLRSGTGGRGGQGGGGGGGSNKGRTLDNSISKSSTSRSPSSVRVRPSSSKSSNQQGSQRDRSKNKNDTSGSKSYAPSQNQSKSRLDSESMNAQQGTNRDNQNGDRQSRGRGRGQGNSRSNLQSRSQSQTNTRSKRSKKGYSQPQSRMATQTASSVSQYSQGTTMTGGEGGGGGYDEDRMNGNERYMEELGNRLTVHQKTKIDLIKESIAKPEGYLPPRYLPTWEEMPIEQRLPLLPAPPGVLFFTRGQLGKTLLRKNILYSMDDPLNRVRVPSDKYEELHDPQNHLETSKIARQYLMNSGTVNEYGEVICTLQEFNRYRRYLASLHNEQVREKIKDMDELKKMEDELKREIIKQEKSSKREERVQYAKEFIKMREDEKLRRFLRKQRIEERRCVELQREKAEYQAFLVELNANRQKMQMRRMKEKNLNEEDKARILLHDYTLKEMRAAANKQHVEKNRKIIHEQRDASWFDAKILSAAERLERENEIRAEYSETLKKRAGRRQKAVEKFREELPLRIAKEKEAKARLDQIVRKFFYRWLDKVRARLNKRVDGDHESVFYTSKRDVLKDGVDFLYKESGYEKLDDVVMNILKFKEALKKQLSKEETLDEEDFDDDEYYDETDDKDEDDE